MRETIYIRDFQYDSDLVNKLDLLLVVKSFDVHAIRKRYLEARKNKTEKTGSVERRKAGLGGLVEVKIDGDKIVSTEVISKLKEPRALAIKDSLFALAPEDKVLLFDDKMASIENDWFSYIHTLKFHPTEAKLLVCSSGFDCFYEYDLDTQKVSYEWFSWEHGLNEGKNADAKSQFLTRNETAYNKLQNEGKSALLISDPKSQSLPTAQRAAFINACDYNDKGDKFILTLFHEGKVIEVDRSTGEWIVLMEGLKNPHGAQLIEDNQLLVTNTANESFIIASSDMETEYSFQDLKDKPDELSDMSWIQNSIVHKNLIISVDSNRNSLILTDMENKRYAMIGYDENWAVQDILEAKLTETQRSLLSEISISIV